MQRRAYGDFLTKNKNGVYLPLNSPSFSDVVAAFCPLSSSTPFQILPQFLYHPLLYILSRLHGGFVSKQWPPEFHSTRRTSVQYANELIEAMEEKRFCSSTHQHERRFIAPSIHRSTASLQHLATRRLTKLTIEVN